MKTELELIRESQAGSTKAANKLCKMHIGFIKRTASKYHINGLEYDDIVQLCYDGLLKAIKDYDLDSGIKLISYSIYKIRGVVSRRAVELTKLKRCADVCSLDAMIFDPEDYSGGHGGISIIDCLKVDHEFYSEDCFEMFEKCIKLASVPELKKKVMREKFNSIKYDLDYTLEDIAEKVDLTRERVRQILKEMRREPGFVKLKRELVELAAG